VLKLPDWMQQLYLRSQHLYLATKHSAMASKGLASSSTEVILKIYCPEETGCLPCESAQRSSAAPAVRPRNPSVRLALSRLGDATKRI